MMRLVRAFRAFLARIREVRYGAHSPESQPTWEEF
jgi:hypothetical protein